MESGIPMKDEEVKAMIADADKNKDGLINYEEFQAMMRKDNMTHDVTGTPISAKKKGAQIVYINTPT
eukprot:7731957-Pyramimonas_sp.AAC.1